MTLIIIAVTWAALNFGFVAGLVWADFMRNRITINEEACNVEVNATHGRRYRLVVDPPLAEAPGADC
jgi:hypothetical protein